MTDIICVFCLNNIHDIYDYDFINNLLNDYLNIKNIDIESGVPLPKYSINSLFNDLIYINPSFDSVLVHNYNNLWKCSFCSNICHDLCISAWCSDLINVTYNNKYKCPVCINNITLSNIPNYINIINAFIVNNLNNNNSDIPILNNRLNYITFFNLDNTQHDSLDYYHDDYFFNNYPYININDFFSKIIISFYILGYILLIYGCLYN